MKNLLYALGIPIALTFASCSHQHERDIAFTEPQPSGEKDLQTFPKNIRGTYISRDSNSLTVTNKALITNTCYYNLHNMKELDSNYVLLGDTILRNIQTNQSYQAKRMGDTLYQFIVDKNTIFSIDTAHIVRKNKNHFILSCKQDNKWSVIKLERSKKLITLAYTTLEDVEKLKRNSITYQDSVPYYFSIQPSSLNNFINEGGFSHTDTFTLASLTRPIKSASKH